MIAVVPPGRLEGSLQAIASKSQAHRLMIAAALCEQPSTVHCGQRSEDIDSTLRCLKALGASVQAQEGRFVIARGEAPKQAVLDVGESGATYRFLLPVAAALGVSTRFILRGRLPRRPMADLIQALSANGVSVSGAGTATLAIEGKLRGGRFQLPGDVSSQFITGLMLAAPLTGADCEILLSSALESRDYVHMTAAALGSFGIQLEVGEGRILIPGGQRYRSPGEIHVEGDWSNGALWLCAAAACQGELRMAGLDVDSTQGDRAVLHMLRAFQADVQQDAEGIRVRPAPLKAAQIDIRNTPDLAPALALLGMAAAGETALQGISRLRLKESDRAHSIMETVLRLGGSASIRGDNLLIQGGRALTGGLCDSYGDHRIVMMAAAAAGMTTGPITIRGAEAVNKSYPAFFDDLRALGLVPALEEEG